MSVGPHNLPPRATNEKQSHLVTKDAWDQLQGYIKLITIKDDNGKTSRAKKTFTGTIISRSN